MIKRKKPVNGSRLKWLRQHVMFSGSECLIWPFKRQDGKHLNFRFNGKQTSAHRVMCELAYGPPPEFDSMALHTCNNGKGGCLNPKHLYWGSRLDNARDSIRDGCQPRGERNGAAKLTAAVVDEVRSQLALGMPQRIIAAEHNISQGSVWRIAKRRTWA